VLVGGDVVDAVADAQAALELAVEQGGWGMAPYVAAFLVEALVERGELDQADGVLSRTELAPWLGQAAGIDKLLYARGCVRLERGDGEAAVTDLLACGERLRRLDVENPAFCPWRSRAGLALAGLGRREEASALVDEELALARRYGAPRGLGIALRARGLLDGGQAGITLLAEAVEVLAGSESRLEYARALVDHGAALRRAGLRRPGRNALREGLDEARRVGALALARQAHDELVASGLRPRKMLAGGVDSLTPSERRVAALAAAGMTNAAIAQHLFVTPKTVETHLGRVYRKLDVPGRTGLAAVLDAADI
jgi:DNA-binding CsgD family transcriptional regulator